MILNVFIMLDSFIIWLCTIHTTVHTKEIYSLLKEHYYYRNYLFSYELLLKSKQLRMHINQCELIYLYFFINLEKKCLWHSSEGRSKCMGGPYSARGPQFGDPWPKSSKFHPFCSFKIIF